VRRNLFRGQFDQAANATLLARIADMPTTPFAEGTPYVAADVASIVCTVTVGGTQTWTASLVPADVISGTLQGWPRDTLGYNFRHALPAAALPTGDALATIVYLLTLADGYVCSLEYFGPVRATP